MKKYINCFYCFKLHEKYYAIDIVRIIPMRINKDVYKLLCQIKEDNSSFENVKMYEKQIGYKEIVFFKECDLLFHLPQNCCVQNSFKELSLSVIPTLGCNLNCKYCYSSVKNDNRAISLKTINDAFEFFCQNYDFNCCRIDFVSGGEPLLTQDKLKQVVNQIQYVLERYEKQSIKWLCTNGTLLNDDILEFLDSNGFNLGISLDGPQEVNDVNRMFKNGCGTYKSVQENVSKLLKNNKLTRRMKYLWNCSVVSSTTHSLVEVINNSYKLGFSNIQMKLVWSGDNNLKLTFDHAINLYEELSSYLYMLVMEGQIDRFLMLCNENDTYGKVLLRIIIQSGVTRRCNAGVNKFSISYDGNLYPCDSFLGKEEYCIGNIYQGFNENYYKINQLRVESSKICSYCWARYLCGGDCFYHALLNTDDINMPDEERCKITKEIIKMGISLVVDLYENTPSNMELIYKILSKRTKTMEPKYGK